MKKARYTLGIILILALCASSGFALAQKDLTVENHAKPIDEVQYTVGTDIPSDYYTFRVSEHSAGKIALTCLSPAFAREFTLTGPAAYTVFLPETAVIELSHEVALSEVELDSDWGLLESNIYRSRLLVGKQIPAAVYLIGLRPGFEDGYFAVYDSGYDVGESDEVNRTALHGAEMYYVAVGEGQYLELGDCYLANYPFDEDQFQEVDPDAVG